MVYRASWGEKPGQKPDRVGIKTLFKIFVYCALMQTGGSVLSTASDKGHAAAPTPPDPATTPGVWGALLLPMGLFLTWVVTPQNKRGGGPPPSRNQPTPPLRDPVRYWPPRLIGVYWPKFQVTKAASTANVTRKAPNWAPPQREAPAI